MSHFRRVVRIGRMCEPGSAVAQLRKRLGMHPVESTWVLVLECGHVAALKHKPRNPERALCIHCGRR